MNGIGGPSAPHLTPTLSPPMGRRGRGTNGPLFSPPPPHWGGGVRGGGERSGPGDDLRSVAFASAPANPSAGER